MSGSVSITTQGDVRFESIQIILLGTHAHARRRHGLAGRVDPHLPQAVHAHPGLDLSGAARARERPHLRHPFNFVVPHHLTIGACNHDVSSDLVHDQHVRLPPTMGSWERDDLSPQMARVEYAVKARVFREPDTAAGQPVKVMEASRSIRVLPASPEDPPLAVGKHDRNYALNTAKTLRKNLISSRLGRLTATAAQPDAVWLRPDGLAISATTAHVQLLFEPASPDVPPPNVTARSRQADCPHVLLVRRHRLPARPGRLEPQLRRREARQLRHLRLALLPARRPASSGPSRSSKQQQQQQQPPRRTRATRATARMRINPTRTRLSASSNHHRHRSAQAGRASRRLASTPPHLSSRTPPPYRSPSACPGPRRPSSPPSTRASPRASTCCTWP